MLMVLIDRPGVGPGRCRVNGHGGARTAGSPEVRPQKKVRHRFVQTRNEALKNSEHVESRSPRISQMPVAFGSSSQTELPDLQKPEVSEVPESRDGEMTGTTTQNKPLTEDLSLSFQTCFDATSPERQQDIRRFIEVFTRTVASPHPSLAGGPDPLTLPPSQLVSCLPLSPPRGTRPRLLRLCPTQRHGHPPSLRPSSEPTPVVRLPQTRRLVRNLLGRGDLRRPWPAGHTQIRGPECA